MSHTQSLAYRRMVVAVARELSAKEVKEIAYIRLTSVEDTSKYTSNPPTALGVDLLHTLERLGVFSQENIKGLVDIVAKDVERHDLVKKVKNYRKTSPRAVKCTAKKERGSLSEKRKQLEETFEMAVTQFDAFGQHLSQLQRALNNGEEGEATESVRGMAAVVQDMGSKLNDVNKRLSPDSSNSSDGDSMLSSGDDTPLRQDMAMGHVSSETKSMCINYAMFNVV